MNKYGYLIMKKEHCMSMAKTHRNDKHLKRFYFNAAVGFHHRAVSMTVYEGLEEMK